MEEVSYSRFRQNLKAYLRQVNEDADELLVTNADPADDVVVLSVSDYRSLMETMRIYENSALFDKVVRGLHDAREGLVQVHGVDSLPRVE